MNRLGNIVMAVSLLCSTTLVGQGVTAAEYFWDTDPGVGNGTTLQAVDGTFGQALEAVLAETSSLPPLGPHKLGIRVRDVNNNWGPVFTTIVVIDPSIITAPDIQVTVAEYFWDNDPGQGNGTAMLAFDGNYNSALEAIVAVTATLPPVGAHVLRMRARDANNTWGPLFSVVVDVMPGVVSFPEVKVTAAEYYLNDLDPGPGNGTPMVAVDGNFNTALEALRGGGIPAPVIAGPNVLWLRARDANGNWGPSFGIVANIDTTIAGTVDVPEFVDDRSVVLLPNPAMSGDGFMVRLSEAKGEVRVLLVDAGGRQVAEHQFQGGAELLIPLNGLATGIYHVGILPRDGRATWRKLLVH